MPFYPDQPFDVQKLPPVTELETLPVLRKAASARAALGEFKGGDSIRIEEHFFEHGL